MPDFQGYFASPKTCANRYYLKARRAKHATSSNKHSFWKAPPGGPVRAFVLAPLAFAHSAADRFWLADARQNRRNWRPLGEIPKTLPMPASHPWLAEKRGWKRRADLSRFVRELQRTKPAKTIGHRFVMLCAGSLSHKARQTDER